MKVGIIGYGAIAQYLAQALPRIGAELVFVVAREGREIAVRDALGDVAVGGDILGAPELDVVVDCAGHQALRDHGYAVLRRGIDLVTVSIGALADDALRASLEEAARIGGSTLHLPSGALGALDALGSAAEGGLARVTYTGRKPPNGWKGSPAEDAVDLDGLTEAAVHFEGSARQAALAYPKNANVAAAVALAGVGFDATQVLLIADPDARANIHEVEAEGEFGSFRFEIAGETLPDNPRTSALAAMSVVKTVADRARSLRV
ncbi:aspartate dehydrogenase [Litoreibacter ponti]|uniref:aspartate dehydrogenase n=1 Tax=Litoreibacter ponti TaxID=1510457 RepID=UPI000D3129D6|nr:aspartate dehydrogenase [Litoreibacter ponti]